ncbi:uncharacterized protein LOC144166600 isoform X2 [Haemaphysalis longicornis]
MVPPLSLRPADVALWPVCSVMVHNIADLHPWLEQPFFKEIEDEEGPGDAAETAAADLQTSPAQAAGRRTRKPVQPLGGVVTRRTSARQVASSASRGNAPTDSGSSPRQASRATRQAGPRTRGTPAGAAAAAATGTAGAEDAATPAATSTPAASPRKGGWKRKKSLDTDELSTSEPEMEHDDSDSDPVWVPGAAGGGSSAATKSVGDTSSTGGDDSVVEPAVKVARRGKPAKGAKGKAGGARKGAAAAAKKPPNGAKSEAEGAVGGGEGGGGGGGGGGGRRGAARKAVEAPPSIDLAASSEVLPESLQLKVQVPGEGEESVVKRDYTRRPSAAANAWRLSAPMMVTVTEASSAAVVAGAGSGAGGELQPGDYIMAMADVHRSRPPIWRIEGRTLLQRFEVIETGEDTLLYRNSSSFSAWNPLEQSKYADITVRVHSNSRNATVVEVLEIHAPPNSSLTKALPLCGHRNGGPEARSSACGGGDKLPSLEEPFEVYLQTLLSHVLDPNFLAEVHRENDEYFLANLQTVDGENERRAARLRCPRWGSDLCRALVTYPRVRLLPHQGQPPGAAKKDEGGSLPCEGCSEGAVTRVAEFSGDPYNKLDLSSESKKPAIKEERGEGKEEVDGWDKRTFLLCATCAGPVPIFSQLHHYKLHAFHCCRDKIERLREDEKVTESHIILERCLQDDTWVNQMYADLQKLWRTCVPESKSS